MLQQHSNPLHPCTYDHRRLFRLLCLPLDAIFQLGHNLRAGQLHEPSILGGPSPVVYSEVFYHYSGNLSTVTRYFHYGQHSTRVQHIHMSMHGDFSGQRSLSELCGITENTRIMWAGNVSSSAFLARTTVNGPGAGPFQHTRSK